MIVFDLASARTIRLTQDGDPDTIENGSASWSPDGQWIAYTRSDASAVPKRAVLLPGDFVYPNGEHGLSEGKGSLVHVRMMIAPYLIEHLTARPR